MPASSTSASLRIVLALCIPVLAAASFGAGWGLARATAQEPVALEERVGALEQRLDAALNPPRPPRAPAAAPAPAEVMAALDIQGAPARGPADAPVTVVAFVDFQCPFCARATETVDRLLDAYPDRVRLVFKHFPLPIHPQAARAHEAAQAAAAQGRFWEMHDRIFAAPERLDRAALVAHAEAIGLDPAAFEAALDAPETGAAVQRDVAEGRRVGVRGTPAFFVNGSLLSGAQPYEAFEARVEQALAADPVALAGADR